MSTILPTMRAELQANGDPHTNQVAHRFFKEEIKVYGIKTATVVKIAKKYWQQAKTLDKGEIFDLCEELYRSGVMEEVFVVSTWLPNYIDNIEAEDIYTFKQWIDSYVTNWAECDSFCNHTVGDLIQKCPQTVEEVKSWAKSGNRWLRRASAVSFIVPAKKGLFLSEALEICDMLLLSGDDLVQKGYGWLLKEESRVHQKEIFDYVMAHREVMPRTALRYAIERMPKELKTQAIQKV